MFKKLTFIVFLFVVGNSFSQNVTAVQKFPESVVPGTDYTAEITINKSAVTGFMKFFQEVPAGCTAEQIESKGGSFTFADGGAKIIWISPPTENQFTISYKVSVPKGASGIKNINGKIAYLDNSERKTYDLETQTIKIGGAAVPVATETKPVVSTPSVTPPPPVVETKKETPAPTPVPVVKKEEPAPAPIVPPAPPVEIKKEEPAPAPVVTTPVKEEKPPVITPVVTETKKEIEKTTAPPEPAITKKEEKKTAPVKLPVGGNVPVTAIPSSGGKTFRVQVGAFNLKPIITGVPQPSTVVLDNGMTKYFSGNFATYEAAAKRKRELIEKGFQGAFIVSFENGKIVK